MGWSRMHFWAALLEVAVVAGACSATVTPGATVSPGATSRPAPTQAESHAPPISKIGTGEGELDLIVRPGYAESGDNDPAYDWVDPFEKKTGCQVMPLEAGTSDQMLARVEEDGVGAWDGISAPGDIANRLIAEGLAQPIDVPALFADWKNIWPPLQSAADNTVDGVHYGVSQGWGANLLMWNTGTVKPDPTSWGAVFDPNSPYKGSVTAYDSAIYLADAALYLSKTKPELGISDPYELSQAQFEAALALLRQQHLIIGSYWSTPSDNITDYEQGTAVLGTTWPYQVHYLRNEDPPIPVKATVPSEGATGWADSWMLLSGAKHPNCMLRWMAWMITPAIQQQVAEWFGEAPANVKACKLMDSRPGPLGFKGFCAAEHATDETYAEQVKLWKTPLADCGDARGNTCIPFETWKLQWGEIKAGS